MQGLHLKLLGGGERCRLPSLSIGLRYHRFAYFPYQVTSFHGNVCLLLLDINTNKFYIPVRRIPMNLNLNSPLNRENWSSKINRNTRFPFFRFFIGYSRMWTAILNFTIAETHFWLFLAYALKYRKNNEKLSPFSTPRLSLRGESNDI